MSKDIKELLEAELNELIDPQGDYPVLDDEGISMKDRTGLTKRDVLMKQIIAKGMRGDTKTMQEILDRIYGKSPQHITQDVNVQSYTGFLQQLADMPDAEFVEIPPPRLPEPTKISREDYTDLEESGLM